MIMGFIDTVRAEGYAVESICRVLRGQGCQIAARTYRAWRAARQPAARTVSDATVINAIFDASFTTDPDGRRRLTPEGAVWAGKDDCVSAPQRVPRCRCLHRRSMHAHHGRRRGAPRQEGPHHHPGQGRPPRRRPAGPRLHRRSAEPGLGCRLRAPRGVREPWRWWEATAGRLSQQACGSWRTIGCLGMGVVGGAVLDNDESFQYCQMGRARLARRRGIREEPVAERSSRRDHRPETWRTWVGLHRALAGFGRRETSRLGEVAGRGGHVKACGVVVAMVQGHSWMPIPSNGRQ